MDNDNNNQEPDPGAKRISPNRVGMGFEYDSKEISIDILQFLLGKKGYSKEELALAMDISVKDLNKILKKKILLEQKHICNFSKKENYKIWKLMLDAIPPHHLSKRTLEKLELCRILSERKNKK